MVTDDNGNFTLPQLPQATYDVWVRGYGLKDSGRTEGRPGDRNMELKVENASSPQEAAQIYPGNYWVSLIDFPTADKFPGTGPVASGGNGFLPSIRSQSQFVHDFKSGCGFCHELGTKVTRTLDDMKNLSFKNDEEAWVYRTSLGVRGSNMQATFLKFGKDAMAKMMADWTRGIRAGAVPPSPPRPSGVERNIVITLWDIGGPQDFMHDEISTDKNDPTVNAYGPIYAVSAGHGALEAVDPVTNDSYKYIIPTREDPREVRSRFPPPAKPSNFWGMEYLWGLENPADPHNPMIGPDGRVWMTSKIRNDEPAWCQKGSDNKYAKYDPLGFSARQASVFDPRTGKFNLIETCFSTHHLQFASDPDNTLYFNELIGPTFGWINTRLYDLTHDEQKAVGWCPQVVDTNGDGRITKPWNPPDAEHPDPKLDTEVRHNMYSVIPDPGNGNVVWGASEDYPGYIMRLDRGNNPPETCITEVYEVPKGSLDPRGIDIDSKGHPWVAMAASSGFARFDRSKCTVFNGPGTDKGEQCAQGWKVWKVPGPKMKNTDDGADFHYYGWVDQHNVMGLGKDTPIINGSWSDSLVALNPDTGKWTRLRVPYPLGFYSRGMDARIDDVDGGWKTRGLYANYGTHLVWHIEGGKGTTGKIVKFQVRPDPLAH